MAPPPAVRIIHQGFLSPPSQGGIYQSFPTVTRTGPGRIMAAFRQGLVEDEEFHEGGIHGYGGDVLVVESKDHGHTFGPSRLMIDHQDKETNEHDSLVTGLGRGLVLLITRSYGTLVNRSFWSVSGDYGRTFSHRKAVEIQGLDLDRAWGRATLAFYGHALQDRTDHGVLLSFYTTLKNGQQQTGLVRFDLEKGSFELWGWIWEGDLRHCHLNETPLLRLQDHSILALCREEPCLTGLHWAISQNNGQTFSKPRPTGLFGEAANLALLPDGRVLAIFRGLSQCPDQGDTVSLSISGDQGRTWSRPFVLEEYWGGRYHGGYGDLAVTEKGQVLAVYYVCDQDGEPRVKSCLFEIEE